MAYERLNLIRQVGAKYWQVFVSLAAIIAPAVKVTKDITAGLTTFQTWLFAGIGLFIIIAIRFPKVAIAVTRLILGPPKSPSNLSTIFKGPRPYSSDDRDIFPGRQKEVTDCWALIEANSFFIIDGESGCGKSSLLNAALLPKARENFRVIECRIADDPFGKLRAALLKEPYRKSDQAASKEELSAAIALAVEGYMDAAAADSRTDKPLLLCIDQCEEIFATVRDEVRNQFVEVLKEAIKDDKLRVILALRSDFFDLLMKVCDAVDPDREIVNLGNYYTLRAFRRDQAEYVLDEVLNPIYAIDPALRPQIEDFAKALIQELLRPPRDKRLSRDDAKTVLPVELQTVGMMIESSGLKNFSVAGLKELGGKIGLLKAYIEEAKIYVWRKTAVPSEKALLILRQLISPAQTKWAQTPQSIAVGLAIPSNQVAKVLDAFADRYLVNLLPITTDGTSSDAVGAARQYELMHEHLVQILIEAPDPVLQKARDAEERLRFWNERTKFAQRIERDGRFRTVRARWASFFAQPIPLGETRSLWKFARSGDNRGMLKRNLRGFSLRMAVVALAIGIPLTVWLAWTRTEKYQIQRILLDAPVAQASHAKRYSAVTEWIGALAYLGHTSKALAEAQTIKDNQKRSEVLLRVAQSLVESDKPNEAVKYLDDAFAGITDSSRILNKIPEMSTALAQALALEGKSNELLAAINKIENPSTRTDILLYVAEGMREANKSAEANQALDEALASSRADHKGLNKVDDLISVTKEIIKAGRIEDAKQPADEIFAALHNRNIRYSDIVSNIYILTKVGKNDDARKLLNKYIAEMKYNSINDPMSRDGEISTIAKATVYLDTKEALALVGDMTLSIERTQTIESIAENLLNIGKVDEAISVLQINGERIGNEVSVSIVVKLIVERQMDKALSSIDKLFGKDSSSWGNYKLGKVIKELINQRKIREAMIVFCNRNNLPASEPTCISELLIDSDKINTALAAAHNIEGDQHRSIALATVASALTKSGKPEEAQHTLDEALSAAEIKWDNYWSVIFREFTHSLNDAGKLKTAIDSAHKIVSDESRLEALAILANEMMDVYKFDEAKEISKEILRDLDKIKDPQARTRWIPLTVRLLAQTGLTDEATRNIEEAVVVTPEKVRESFRRDIRFDIINGLARSGKSDEAKEAFQQAIAEIGDSTNINSDYFAVFASALAQIGDIDSAFEIARQAKTYMGNGSDVQYEILTSLSTEMAKSVRLAEAMKSAREISNMDNQSAAILSVVKQLVKAGKTTEALSVTGEIKSAFDRSKAFAVIAQGFASLRSFRLARLTADNCSSPADKLGVYTAILLENAKAQYPRLQTKLDAIKAKIINNKDDEDDEDE
ncbi:MAG: hypothetical protein WBV94_15050 [Blastocatellia bacterium]